MSHREPILDKVPIDELRPTQITVGYHEVAAKQREWRERSAHGEETYLGRHMVPVVLGPRGRRYLIDHHHLALALLKEGQTEVLTTVVTDLSGLSKSSFWTYLDNRGLCHPYDAKGVRRAFADIPRGVLGLEDDPYRSLAGELRRSGGFAKDTTPFSEFLWADFLRTRVKSAMIEDRFAAAVEKALSLARSEAAVYLPGWCGPHSD
jgi:hypothetical protein